MRKCDFMPGRTIGISCVVSIFFGIIVCLGLYGVLSNCNESNLTVAAFIFAVVELLIFLFFVPYFCNIENLYRMFFVILLFLLSLFGYFFASASLGKVDIIREFLVALTALDRKVWICGFSTLSISTIVIFGFAYFFLWEEARECSYQDKNEELFRQRKADFERVRDYIARYEMVCVDADWGQGKTFLMEEVEKKLQDKYEFVRFKPLSYDMSNIMRYVLSEIQVVLRKNSILRLDTDIIKKMAAKNEYAGILHTLCVGEDETSAVLFEDLLRDCKKLEKIIVLIFEDIDRCSDFDILARIFAISETLALSKSKSVKVVFECNKKVIQKMVYDHYHEGYCKCNIKDSYSVDENEYLEKYLSHTVSLTCISLKGCVENFLELDKDTEGHCREFGHMEADVRRVVENTNVSAFYPELSFLFDYIVPVRAAHEYIKELSGYLADQYWIKYKITAVPIVMLALKYFASNKYDEYDRDPNSLKKAGVPSEKHENFTEDECNRIFNLDILERLEYSGENPDKIDLYGHENDYYINHHVLWRQYNNAQIFAGIRHFFYAGYPKLTDIERAVSLFYSDVLERPEDKWHDLYLDYIDGYFYNLPFKVTMNNTIYYFKQLQDLGLADKIYAITLSRAIYLCGRGFEDRKKFLKFYFSEGVVRNNQNIDNAAIAILRACLENLSVASHKLAEEWSLETREVFLPDDKENRDARDEFVVVVIKYYNEKILDVDVVRNRTFWNFIEECIRYIRLKLDIVGPKLEISISDDVEMPLKVLEYEKRIVEIKFEKGKFEEKKNKVMSEETRRDMYDVYEDFFDKTLSYLENVEAEK